MNPCPEQWVLLPAYLGIGAFPALFQCLARYVTLSLCSFLKVNHLRTRLFVRLEPRPLLAALGLSVLVLAPVCFSRVRCGAAA